jgi:hypothetical protein
VNIELHAAEAPTFLNGREVTQCAEFQCDSPGGEQMVMLAL